MVARPTAGKQGPAKEHVMLVGMLAVILLYMTGNMEAGQPVVLGKNVVFDALNNAERELDKDTPATPKRPQHKTVQNSMYTSGENDTARRFSLGTTGVRFTPGMMPTITSYENLDTRLKALPKTKDAPDGEAAMELSREWGLPKSWNARHHPTHFILGAPKGGTTFLERCYSSGALSGDSARMPYPRPAFRWPYRFQRNGEPYVWFTGFAYGGLWNRTGFRMWDLHKEPRVYRHCGNSTEAKYYRAFESFPPIEPESRHWEVLDATPSYLHNPWATENVYADHIHDLHRPRFVIAWRDGMERAFSHYVMIVKNHNNAFKQNAFIRRMNKELSMWDSEGCAVLKTDPETLLEPGSKERLRWVLANCFVNPIYLGMSLPVLGLRYWLHHFPAEQFTVLRTAAMKKSDPFFLIDILADSFKFKRVASPCTAEQDWQKDNCTGPSRWEQIKLACSDPAASGGTRQASYSSKASSIGLHQGTEQEQEPFIALFKRYDALMLKLIRDYNVKFID
eukprot:TRINITY_DN11637_c5_g1_i1.p1 TRINITY_DN11637_c5_g1~~TRINITY_DN11637_c5_g1_i1.p1  ORF type:complete len:540 (+),score=78.00 TRINITY_DN11637_c5_g1_i1:98-1621(+)